ncbi:MAG: hypothetical protein JXR68_02520 [Bacteroidales bacterium]|nr:hypothetical protein [Bacteroidales bacterium]
MKRSLILFLFAIIIISACKNESLYSFNRPHFANSFITWDKKDLKTAAFKDTLFVQNGQGVISSYFAIVQCEFAHVQDTIVQYGHCWSVTDKMPTINNLDTASYSRYHNWQYDSLGTFTSYISLLPETPFYVRSYIITSTGDTGYNQQVYIDTTIPPINEWFVSNDFGNGSDGREGAVAFTITYNGSTKAYLTTGKDGSDVFGDLWEFTPETEVWMQMPGTLNPGRSEAVGFGMVTTDDIGRKTKKIYVGTGLDASGSIIYNDFWEYNFNFYEWNRIDSFPMPVRSGVAFVIDERAYVGTGKSYVDVGDFYMFDYKRLSQNKNPWIVMPGLGDNSVANARRDAVAFVINGVGFVGLGKRVINGNTQYFNDLFIFKPPDVNGYGAMWGVKESFPSYPRAEAVGFTIENQGYVGLGADGTDYFKDLYRYDPFNDRWFQIADYKVGPNYSGQIQKVKNAVAFGIDKKGYVGTGYNGDDNTPRFSKEMWIYRPW